MGSNDGIKVKGAMTSGQRSSFRVYRDLTYGDTSLGFVVKAEFLQLFLGSIPGALGLFLRSKLYRSLFGATGKKLVVGRNVTLRHSKKIRLGDNVILDDNAMIDAKGGTNRGIRLDDNVYVGRNTIIYCKNGDIHLEERVNVSSNCTVFSSHDLTIGAATMIGAYSYILSGGEYDYTQRDVPFAEQSGMETKGPLRIGADCWIAARVTVLDGATVGNHCVLGAGAVVTGPIPEHSLAVVVPGKVIKNI